MTLTTRETGLLKLLGASIMALIGIDLTSALILVFAVLLAVVGLTDLLNKG